MSAETMNDEIDFDEEGYDCEGCELDYDDGEEEDELDEEDRPKNKKPKTKEKTVEDYLEVLKNSFDDVLWEERTDEWFDHVTYQHLECRTHAAAENLNPAIEYVVWVSLDIGNGGHFTRHKEQLKYICDNLKLLRSDKEADFLGFFEPKKLVNKGGNLWGQSDAGMPDFGIHKKHAGMKKPTAQDFAEAMKSVVRHVFENAPLDQENDRFGRKDDYWFDTCGWSRIDFDRYKSEGIEPIALFLLFSFPMRIYLGPRLKSWSEMSEKEYVYYWIWSDANHNWHDRNGNTHKLDLINETDIIEWLYGFTGFARKSHDIEGEVMSRIIRHLRNHSVHKDIEDGEAEIEKLAKKVKSPKELRQVLTNGINYDPNGGFGGNGWLSPLGASGNHCLDKKIEFRVSIYVTYAKYLKIDFSAYPKDRWGDSLHLYDAQTQDIFETVYNHFNPKPKVLNLFDDFGCDDDAVEKEAVEASNIAVGEQEHPEEDEDCVCGCDFDEEGYCEDGGDDMKEGGLDDEDLEEEEKPKGKAKKPTGKTVEGLLDVLRTRFDEVTFEERRFYQQIPKVTPGAASQMSERYFHLTCSMLAPLDNKNPTIQYMTWFELKIRDHHEFVLHTLRDVVRQYGLLVKNEDLRFFDEENMFEIDKNKRIGLNHYLLYKDRKNDPIPSYGEVLELRKKYLKDIFQNGILEENNPRLGVEGRVDYHMSGYDFLERTKPAFENGIDDTGLMDLFGMKIYAGVVKTSLRTDGSQYVRTTYEISGRNVVHDGDNNTDYYYGVQDNKGYAAWLREFTKIPERKVESLDKEIELAIVQYLRYSHKFESEAELFKALKQTSSVDDFIKRCGTKYGHQWAKVDYHVLHVSYSSSDGIVVTLDAGVAKHYGFKTEGLKEFGGYKVVDEEVFIVANCCPYKFVFERFNPRPKTLNLFDDFDSKEVEPANNIQEDAEEEFDPFSLFA